MTRWGIHGGQSAERSELIEHLVIEFAARGVSTSVLRQAPPDFDVDQTGKDSHRHRTAGASEVVLSTQKRWALMHELRDAPMPDLETLLAQLSPVDLVLIEGFKDAPHPKTDLDTTDPKNATAIADQIADALDL